MYCLPQLNIIKQIYDICNKYQFVELNEDEKYIQIEYIGDFKSYYMEDFETKYDYYRITEKECDKNIAPYFLQCWEELQTLNNKYNIFKEWEWDADEYMCWYLNFTDEFCEKILKLEQIGDNMEKETLDLIKKCNILLKYNPGFTTNKEQGYANIKVEYDEGYNKNVLWINPYEDELMTVLDLQALYEDLSKQTTVRLNINGGIVCEDFWNTFHEKLEKSNYSYNIVYDHK